MIRAFHLADLFTIANGFCGMAAVFQAMRFLATGERGACEVPLPRRAWPHSGRFDAGAHGDALATLDP